MLVLPVAGAPLAAEIVEERGTRSPDGTFKTAEITTSKVFRDADGRLRTETDIKGSSGESEAIVTIMDRANGFMALLAPSQKMGGRFQFPKQDPSQRAGISFLGNPLIRIPGEKSFHTETLGSETIDGIEYEGERTTTTLKEQPSVLGEEERWFARDLGLFALMKSSGPDEQSIARLTKVDRHAPDPALFQIPPDYAIQDLKDDLPPR